MSDIVAGPNHALQETDYGISGVVDTGRTVFHLYPGQKEREEIWNVMGEWALTAHKKRVTVAELTRQLNDMFPDLDCNEPQVHNALDNYIAPALARLMPNVVQRRLIKEGAELDTTAIKFKRIEKMQDQIESIEATPAEEWTKEMSQSYNALTRNLRAMLESAEVNMERFRIINPAPKEITVNKTERRLNVNATLEKLGLGNENVIDTEWEPATGASES